MNENAEVHARPQQLFTHAKELMNSSPEEALTLLEKAQSLAEEDNEYDIICEVLLYRSRNLRFQGDFFQSVEQLNKAYRLLNRHIPHNNNILAHIYKEFGSLYSDGFHDHATALNYSLKSLQLNVAELRPSLFNNIGSHYISLKEYIKALPFLKKGQELCKEIKDTFVLCFIYENFGNLFRLQEKYSEAIEYYQKGLEVCDQASFSLIHRQPIKYIECYIQIGLAKVYFNLGEFDKVDFWVKKIENIANSSNLPVALSQAYLLKGELLLEKNQTEAFETLFNETIVFCNEMSFFTDQRIWLEKIIKLYESQERYAEALAFSKKMIANKEDHDSKTKAINLSKVLENKEMEILELENRNRQMQLQKDQLEQFAYIVAHDLKTPLSNISNFIGLFLNRYKEEIDEKHQFYLDFALDNSKRLYKMLEDLLHYITVKEAKGDFPICDVEKLLSQLLVVNSEQIKQKNAHIEYGELPGVRIQCFHLEIVLDNLIRNAMKFSRKDNPPHIIIDLKEGHMEYAFKISDNGIGIEEEYRQKIFDVFKQLDKVNYKGTGMGLSICKRIIQVYGGKIWVTGNERGGTSFHFNIPKKAIIE